MSLILRQSITAIVPNMVASFAASGGAEPYVYSVLPGGAGGTIDADDGSYTAPSSMGSTPQTLYDTIQVEDDDGDTATAQILVATPLFLLCDIIQTEMELDNGRVYLWDQKIFQPADSDIYVIVTMGDCKPYANRIGPGEDGWGSAVQSVNMLAKIDIDIISRGPGARDRKEEIILALKSIYAQSQQETNSFYIATLSTGFINLSMVDGAAIPYRYRISVNMQYQVTKTKDVPYFDTFEEVTVVTDP